MSASTRRPFDLDYGSLEDAWLELSGNFPTRTDAPISTFRSMFYAGAAAATRLLGAGPPKSDELQRDLAKFSAGQR